MLGAHTVPINFHDYDVPLTVKTPGRALHKNRRENAHTVGASHRKKVHIGTPFTGKAKGKTLGLGRGPQTDSKTQYLLTLDDKAPGGSKQSILKPKTEIIQTIARPLGDKTPAPNRAAQLLSTETNGGKLGKLDLDPALPAETPAPAPTPFIRPSSTRKSTRARRSSSLSIGGLQQKLGLGPGAFQTPKTNGCPWDVSEMDIQVPETMEEGVEAAEESEDDSEIEYMPPRAEEQPYEPPFPMPDYKQLGNMLRTLAYTPKVYDEPVINWKGKCFQPSLPARQIISIFRTAGEMTEEEEQALLRDSGFTGVIETLSGPPDDRPIVLLDLDPPVKSAPPAPAATGDAKQTSGPIRGGPSNTVRSNAMRPASRPIASARLAITSKPTTAPRPKSTSTSNNAPADSSRGIAKPSTVTRPLASTASSRSLTSVSAAIAAPAPGIGRATSAMDNHRKPTGAGTVGTRTMQGSSGIRPATSFSSRPAPIGSLRNTGSMSRTGIPARSAASGANPKAATVLTKPSTRQPGNLDDEWKLDTDEQFDEFLFDV
ncbi:hypothetical protein PUNSTDRAFT_141657 [Punctularia strigosozonata HHB-11173 SS5]|uniref:uncharacterized protein n=1 Tax=Punctularia strigosozonata (strain HHB-11173) TaxID=741275 RepID=UPI0004416FF1|nr:uncharacterized protein PUNSTDRAFT_141657 [Punctularia strigosozonata HHB-11173 SS5]EIN11215.1 hypothetical protein PUNSTDRAFT_141657 [Punctularia strigosozonata HHB-11173 SS5]